MSKDSSVVRATRREWVGLGVIALPCVLYSMDLTVLNLAVPHLSADLKPTGAQLLWIVDIYGFLLAGWLITMGTLGDRIGRRRLLMFGAAAFGAASVLAAFSSSAEMLIAARALLGVAGATLAPSTLSLIRNMFHDARQRTFAISVWIGSFSAGGAIGPLVGGALLEHFWWGSVFLVAVPVMALLLAVGPFLLPEYKDPEAGRLDIPSALLSLVAVLAAIYGVKRIAESGVDPIAIAAILTGVALGALFVRRQKRIPDPLIDLGLFRLRVFSASLAINGFGFFSMFGMFLFIAQYLQMVLGMGPLEAGIWTAPSGVAFVASSMVSPAIVHRFSPAWVTAVGLAIGAAGFALITQVGGPHSLAILVTGCVVLSLGITPVVTATVDLIVGSAPPERAGSASAISETCTEFGGALGIALLGSILTMLYRFSIDGALPASLSPDAAEAARGTLGGALTAAAELTDASGIALTEAARAAFSAAFVVVAAICAGAVAATAVLAFILLRRVPAPAAAALLPESPVKVSTAK